MIIYLVFIGIIRCLKVQNQIDVSKIASRHFPLLRLAASAPNYSNTTTIKNPGYYYTIAIGVGTPAQDFYVQVDTGSSILWVTNETCLNCSTVARFNSTESSTFEEVGDYTVYTYTMGTVAGYFAYDIVEVLNTPMSDKFEFLLANEVQDIDFTSSTTGIMGLSNNPANTNIFQAAYASSQITSELFGFVLTDSALGSYLLYDEFNSSFLDSVVWIPTIENSRWALDLLSIQVGSSNFTGGYSESVFDTGTTCIYIDPDVYNQIFDQYINCTFCSCNGDYPDLVFYFRGAKVIVPAEQYIIPDELGCTPCLYAATTPFNVLGDPFMRSFVSVFDKEKQKIGLYNAVTLNQVSPYMLSYVQLFFNSCFILFIIFFMCQIKKLEKLDELFY